MWTLAVGLDSAMSAQIDDSIFSSLSHGFAHALTSFDHAMTFPQNARPVAIGVLALQGAFAEHLMLLRQAAGTVQDKIEWRFSEVRTADELARIDALIIPGGESTTMSLVASRSGLLEPLRHFVKVRRKPVWGTCAGLILLSESANRTKKGGQELIGGLDVRVNRNHFGRQVESFEADLSLPFISAPHASTLQTFHTVFIRAPIVEKILPHQKGEQTAEARVADTVIAPSRSPGTDAAKMTANAAVEVLARLPPSAGSLDRMGVVAKDIGDDGDIVAVRQGNVFGTAFHPELTNDSRIHAWWLTQVVRSIEECA